MTVKLPIFPLQLVVFPGEQLNLHIFEERYRQLIQDAEQDGITFCVPTVHEEGILPIATEVKLVEVVNRYPSGELDVRTRGERIFFLEDYWKTLGSKLYPGGQCRLLDVETEEDPTVNAELIDLTRSIYRELDIDKVLPEASAGFRTYDIGHYVGLTLPQEYELLTLRRADARQRYLLDHLRSIRPELQQSKKIQDRALMNGHFKELVPPEW